MPCAGKTPGTPGITRCGFTLFEVAISLGLAAFGVVSVMMLFPQGIKAQQMARSRFFAATKALEMVDSYNSFNNATANIDNEAPDPWDVPTGRCSSANDLERRLASPRFGIAPLPTEIAKRLDSDGDEIRQILGDGGLLYYSQPQAAAGFMETGTPAAPPVEAQRLVFAVVGYAQDNAIHVFPWKAWPYYTPYPSPPMHGYHQYEADPAVLQSVPADALHYSAGSFTVDPFQNSRDWDTDRMLIEDANDPDMRKVFTCTNQAASAGAPAGSVEFGYKQHFRERSLDSALRYCAAALWYCERKFPGAAASYFLTSAPLTTFPTSVPQDRKGDLVNCLRFLSHATTCLTAFASKGTLDAGVMVPQLTVDSLTSPAALVTTSVIINQHESCLDLAMLFAASYPYDWAAPRPENRMIMMDHPLLEYDLFPTSSAPMLSGRIWPGNPLIPANQWRPIAAQPIVHIGRSYQFPSEDIPSANPVWSWWGSTTPPTPPYAAGQPSTFWGDPSHFTLTNTFEPSERCRQLVFWAVDWMQYEDCETAPSAPIDASRYTRSAPKARAAAGGPVDTVDKLFDAPAFMEWAQQSTNRNPEKTMIFSVPTAGKPDGYTGADVGLPKTFSDGFAWTLRFGNDGVPTPPTWNPWAFGHKRDQGMTPLAPSDPDPRKLFLGRFGADRNFNGRLDRGTLPVSVRLRAQTVARFNYYDLRVPAMIR